MSEWKEIAKTQPTGWVWIAEASGTWLEFAHQVEGKWRSSHGDVDFVPHWWMEATPVPEAS